MKRSFPGTTGCFYLDKKVPQCLKSRLFTSVSEMTIQYVISSINAMCGESVFTKYLSPRQCKKRTFWCSPLSRVFIRVPTGE